LNWTEIGSHWDQIYIKSTVSRQRERISLPAVTAFSDPLTMGFIGNACG